MATLMLREEVRQFFVNAGIQPCRIAVAASGGIDSTALVLALHSLREESFDLVALHVNHRLRGAESDADEAFVRELCARLDVPLHVADGSLDPERVRERGIEAAAREVRYACLAAGRERSGARYVATGHQKNDQAETVLMRLLTGSGIAGLRGIHPHRGDGFIRPLLEVTRAEIEAFLAQKHVVARVDRSNEDPRFLRNRLRTLVRELDATDNLAAIAGQARAIWPILERAIDDAGRDCVRVFDRETHFLCWPADDWIRGALLQRHIRRLDPHARDFDATRIAAAAEGIRRLSITRNLELVRKGDTWILRPPPQPTGDFEIELTPDKPAFVTPLGITMHAAQRAWDGPGLVRHPATAAGRQLIQLPHGAEPAFTVRNRRPGDRFQPLGMSGAKKLKDFLIDRKIDADIRDRLPLLVWNGEIVWIAGVEVSERFKVTDPGGVLYEVWTDDRDQAGRER